MTRGDLDVTPGDVSLTLAVKGALLKMPKSRIVEIVRANPGITVRQFCESYLAGVQLRCYGGTRRAYGVVYGRLHRARKKLGITISRQVR
jgi:ribosomal protein L30E